MSENPYFTYAQQRAAYLALGLDPTKLRDTYQVVIDVAQLTVHRYSRDTSDKFHLVAKDTLATDEAALIRGTRRSYGRKQRRTRKGRQ